MADLVGQELGAYRLTRLLGEGGFAQVYLGEHSYLGTQAAIKALDLRLGAGELDAFYSEARTIARLAHPNIVRVLDFGVQDRVPYLVLEYAPHGTLRERHPRGTRLALDVIVPYVQQTAAALQYAHDQRLIHRDVKPENLLLSHHDDVLLSDFGIAIVAQTSQRRTPQDIIGTVSYMAPEQFQGKPRPASDQYALGVVVYEWISGRLPFDGPYREIALQHLLAEPPPLSDVLPDVSPTTERVIRKALAKEPADRFASVQGFAEALAAACQDERSSPALACLAEPTGATERSSERSTRLPPERPHLLTRRRALVGAAGLAVAGGGLTWLLLSARKQRAIASIPRPLATAAPTAPLTPTPPPTPTPAPPANLVYTYRGHTGYIHTVAWSPNGRLIASGGDDATVQIWDALTGVRVVAYRGHTGPVYGVAWSPDGKLVASASADSTVHVWEAANASLLINFSQHEGPVHALAWSPDGQRIASGSDDRTIKLWYARLGSNVITYGYQGGFTWALAWSPDGRYIVAGDSRGVAYVFTSSGELSDPRFPNGAGYLVYAKHSDSIETVAWSPNGQRIASGALDKRVQVWDAFSGDQVVPHTGQTQGISSLSWSRDGGRIASASLDGTVQIWQAATGETLSTYRGHRGSVWTVAWSPDDAYLASGGADGTVQVWRPA